MKVKNSGNYIVILAMVVAASLSRLVPHAPNFTAVGAMALFAGAMWGISVSAFLVPVASLALTDLVFGEHPTMIYVYGSMLLITGLGAVVLKQKSGPRVVGMSLAASLLFFVITNFGVWASGGLYPLNLAGLTESYLMGLPFLKYQVAGDLLYSVGLFSLYQLAEKFILKSGSAAPGSSV